MTQFIENEYGYLSVYQQPERNMVYTLGIDAASGLAEDYSAMQVLTNTIPFVQVATFHGKIPVNRVTEYADMLGRWYNTALIICEVNYPGNSVQDALLQYYKYPRNYQPESHLDEDPSVSVKYGFRTTETTKWMLIHELQMVLASREILINDRKTLDEMLNFVYLQSASKAGAAVGFNDDLVMALMLALHGARLYPFLRPIENKKDKTPKTEDPDTKRDWRIFKERLSARMSGKKEEPVEIL